MMDDIFCGVNEMDERKRRIFFWNTLRPVVKLGAKYIFNYDGEICTEEGPLLILANHNADLDPMLLVSAFPETVYFVASEHILRGKAGGIMRLITDLIPRQKGGSAGPTIRSIIDHASKGHNVCMFAEGNRSWDGITRRISPSTAGLVKSTGAKLVTFRTEGMYFSNPRWAGSSLRRGKTRGRVVGIYGADQLASLTDEQVQEIIERDLYENAYERQRKNPVSFKGRKLAEHLETLLFVCPHCGAVNKMRSEGDHFYCDECGTKLRYTPEGFFTGENVVYDSVLDWSEWQKSVIEEKCRTAAEDELIFSDDMMELYSVNTGRSSEFLCCGRLRLYRDLLVLPNGTKIPVHDIYRMSIKGPQDLFFTVNGKSFVIRSSRVRCTGKYLTACAVYNDRLEYGI